MTSSKRSSVLVVDDEPYILTTLAALLENEFDVSLANSADEAQEVFRTKSIDVILSDQKMPRRNGVELLEWVRTHHPKTMRLLMTGFAELEDAVGAINRGKVYRYLFKPWRSEELLQVLRDACRSHQLEQQNQVLLEELHQLNLALEKRVLERTQSLEQANREMQQKNFMLEKLALTDPLTGLPNRRAIDRLAESEIRRRGRYPSALALGFVDADNFKEINRRYLLPGGDQVLIDLARALNASMRTVDTVGRVGAKNSWWWPETTYEGALAWRADSLLGGKTPLFLQQRADSCDRQCRLRSSQRGNGSRVWPNQASKRDGPGRSQGQRPQPLGSVALPVVVRSAQLEPAPSYMPR